MLSTVFIGDSDYYCYASLPLFYGWGISCSARSSKWTKNHAWIWTWLLQIKKLTFLPFSTIRDLYWLLHWLYSHVSSGNVLNQLQSQQLPYAGSQMERVESTGLLPVMAALPSPSVWCCGLLKSRTDRMESHPKWFHNLPFLLCYQ